MPFKSQATKMPADLAPVERQRQAEPEQQAAELTGPDPEEKLRHSRLEADRTIQAAQARAAEIERAARERGLAEAQAKIQDEVNRAVHDLREKLAQSLEEIARLRAEMAAQAEHDLVRLALEIAKKVVRREVRVDQDVALTLARVALARLHSRVTATVRLHPDDYAYAFEHRERIGAESTVEIVEDRTISPGGCIVISDLGEIDARIEQQFAGIERDFLGGRG